MKKLAAIVLWSCAVLLPVQADCQRPKTLFDYLETSYVVGELRLARPLKFRDGLVLAFPTTVRDVVYARIGKPHALMIVVELATEGSEPPIKEGEVVFAPVELLPKYSYWRDNLPKTPLHAIQGGARYVFRGDDIERVRPVVAAFTKTLSLKRAQRWPDQARAVVDALFSPVTVVREDAVRYLAGSAVHLKAMDAQTRAMLAKFLSGEYPNTERVALIEALAASGIRSMAPALNDLARRDDEIGAAALRALEALGEGPPTAALRERRRSDARAVRVAASEILAARVKEEPALLEELAQDLERSDQDDVRAAIARGLAAAGEPSALAPLARALDNGGDASQPIASAIAAIGGDDAASALKRAIAEGPPAAQAAAVVAMVELQTPCDDCLAFLRTQYEQHPDKGVRDLIGIMLEVNRKHEH